MRTKFNITDETPIQVTSEASASWRGVWGEYSKTVCPADSVGAVLKALQAKGKYTLGGFTVELGKIHKFEAAGLGKAPFRFVGMNVNTYQACAGAPIQAGGSCDYCGTGIMYEFRIRSTDGKESVVGCDCINKVGDMGLKRMVETSPEYRKWEAEKKAAKTQATIEELKALITTHEEAMQVKAHPMGFTDRTTGKPLTYRDYVTWMYNHCGHAGRTSLVKAIKKAFVS
jgi:hypothetical protein